MTMQLKQIYQLFSHFGPSWLLYRAIYSQQLRWGVFRARLPVQAWEARPLASYCQLDLVKDEAQYLRYRQEAAPEFFFSPTSFDESKNEHSLWDSGLSNPLEESTNLERGMMPLFSHSRTDVGFPPAWHRNPLTGESIAAEVHWSAIDEFSSGDVKLIWEPNRFSSAYLLVRAYARTGSDHYAELFWKLVESWRAANPPQQGINWKCGQETALRVMAWCFGLYGFLESSVTTSEQVSNLVQMIAVSGQRIESNLRYALSQKNNHGISEATALWTIGSLFPELSRAGRWKHLGGRLLEQQAEELIYKDGAFSQHSMNYHRVMLHNYLWVMRLAEIHEQPFSQELYQSIRSAGEFLYLLQDSQSGQVPNYGHNDGALVLPLNNCDYSDYRPIVQATRYLTNRQRFFSSGPWDEDLLWLFGKESLRSPVEPTRRTSLCAEESGYYTLRAPTGFAMTRFPTYRHRPAQADASHVDLWWRGQNIAVDPGTYSYNAKPPWDNVLGCTRYHNTVTVDNTEQMTRAGRFLWLPWLSGEVTQRKESDQGKLQYLEGQHDGYARLESPVNYRRAILRLGEEHWLVIDQLVGSRLHNYRLHWLFVDAPFHWLETERRLQLETSVGTYNVQLMTSTSAANASVVRADNSSPRGWQSRYYSDREPAVSLSLQVEDRSTWFYSLLGPDECQWSLRERILQVTGPSWAASVRLAESSETELPLVDSARWTDPGAELLSIA